MLSILFNPKRAERHPLEMMLVGIFYSSVSLLLSALIFPKYSSLIMVFFTVLSCIYVVQGAIKSEEGKEKKGRSEIWILKEHSRLILFLLFLFIGFVISFAFWTVVLPNEKVSELFSLQSSSVEQIKSDLVTGSSVSNASFFLIILNNLKVLALSLIFAFFYGAGAIFVLVWNASVMGLVIGNLIKTSLGIIGMPVAFAKYFVHGIPEMLAYLITALAGGIIYTSIWKGHFFKIERRKKIIFDAVVLILISLALLIIAALIEVYISPYI